MYETINGYPVEEFCEWYNKKYNSNLHPDMIEFELSYDELSILADMFSEEKENSCV